MKCGYIRNQRFIATLLAVALGSLMNHNIALARSASNEQVDSYSAGRDNVMQNTNASQAQFVQADATVLPDSNQAAANFAVQPSAEQRATVDSAEFKQRYSTNVRVTIRGGLTSPSRPLRIAVAWDGQGQPFEAEQVYDGTSTFIANHVYDPQGREKITVNPQLRVTDPAVLNADGTPFALVETLSLDVYPVYDITLSPLRSEEIHRGDGKMVFLVTVISVAPAKGLYGGRSVPLKSLQEAVCR